MAAASRDDRPADERLAANALLSLALVHAMLQLKFPALARTIHIIGYRRPAQPDSFLEDGLNGAVELP
jgi:hypothetical protein